MVQGSPNLGEIYGCLEIQDDGFEFTQVINASIAAVEEEKAEFLEAVQEKRLSRNDVYKMCDNQMYPVAAFEYTPKTFINPYPMPVNADDFEKAISDLREKQKIKHYKCKCKKCGKIRYYTSETLLTNPPYCFRPIYFSGKFTYSIKAANAACNKRTRYEKDESVCFINDKSKMVPSEQYCDSWNKKRNNDIKKQAVKEADIIAALPRRYAKNYDDNYAGLNYESLKIAECINSSFEIVPKPHYSQFHRKIYSDVIVCKLYRCRCYLCGKEQDITCDKFGIYPPTSYGYRAYDGYWSEVKCPCRDKISSFQWIVNKLLFENRIQYEVEYSFPSLYGISKQNRLKFDFAIFAPNGSLSCLIECQGEQHFRPVEEFGGESKFQTQTQNDALKREYCKIHSIPLIEISYKDKSIDAIRKILRNNNIISEG